jgi:hypothetical protein
MRKLNLLIALVAGLAIPATGLLTAAPAMASSSSVIADCNANGYLTGHYSRSDLQGALKGMGADVKEYTNCYDVVRRALLASASGGTGGSGGHGGGSAGGIGGSGSGIGGSGSGGGGSGSGGGGTSYGSTGATGTGGTGSGRSAVSTRGVYNTLPGGAASDPGSPNAVQLGGSTISPGSAGVNAGSSLRSIPMPLIIVLVLLGLAALSGGGVAIRHRVVTRHGA